MKEVTVTIKATMVENDNKVSLDFSENESVVHLIHIIGTGVSILQKNINQYITEKGLTKDREIEQITIKDLYEFQSKTTKS